MKRRNRTPVGQDRDQAAAESGLAEEQELWRAIREVNQSRGLDLAETFDSLAGQVRFELPSLGPREAFDSLCSKGCHPWILAALLHLVRARDRLQAFWQQVVGPAGRRATTTRALDSAAATIERTFGSATPADEQAFASIGRLPPSRLAAELRLYGRALNLASRLASDFNIKSLEQATMLVLVDYVNVATKRPHHDEVASLVGAAREELCYDESAQRQWTHRNRALLHSKSPARSITRLLVALGEVFPRS